jgi:AhpD family alkylhydroperoxidase
MSTTTTQRRVKISTLAPEFYKALIELDAVSATGLDPRLADLVRLRASQLNGCAYCLDMHTLDAKHAGEKEQRLHVLSAWREAPKFFTEQEKAAFALTEAITLIGGHGVPDDVYAAAAEVFDDKELAQLIGLIIMINAWNRVAVTGHLEPGHYDPS